MTENILIIYFDKSHCNQCFPQQSDSTVVKFTLQLHKSYCNSYFSQQSDGSKLPNLILLLF